MTREVEYKTAYENVMIANKMLRKENEELKSNWNELKEWINEQKEFIKDLPTYTNDIMNNHIGIICGYNNVLEEMIELESDKND